MTNHCLIAACCLILLPGFLPAQTPTTLAIRGKVVDQQTNEPLPYASVGVKGKPIGTVANAEGAFDFYVPAAYARDTFFVSFVGYEPYQSTVAVAERLTAFSLPKKTVMLDEILIVDRQATAKEIVQRAVARIGENYPTEPYLLEGFFRGWNKNEMPDDYVRQYGAKHTGSLLEAAVTVYDEGYARQRGGKRLREDVYLNEIRRSQLPPGQWEYRNELGVLLEGNYVKYNQARGNVDMLEGPLDLPNEPEYQLLEPVEDNGETLYVIGVAGVSVPATTTKSTAAYRLFISQRDYAILRIDLVGTAAGDGFVHQGSRDSRWKCIAVDNTLRFRRYHGKLYPSYLRTDWKIRQIGEAGAVLQGQDFYRELLINQIITTEVEQKKRSLGKPMKEKRPLEEQLKTYRPEFWQH